MRQPSGKGTGQLGSETKTFPVCLPDFAKIPARTNITNGKVNLMVTFHEMHNQLDFHWSAHISMCNEEEDGGSGRHDWTQIF